MANPDCYKTTCKQCVQYSVGVGDCLGGADGGFQFEFIVPGHGEQVRVSYYSCNGVQHVKHAEKLEKAGGTFKMWDDLATEHNAKPFHVLLGGGDDLYMDTDALWKLPELEEEVLYSVKADRNTEVSTCSAVCAGEF